MEYNQPSEIVKDVNFGKNAKNKVTAGVEKLAKAVKPISEDAQIHISIAFLIKAMVAVAIVVGSWYQAQMQFAEQKRRIEDLENKVTVLSASV